MKTIVELVEELKEYLLGKDTAAKQAVESNIAPVEADPSSASRAYVVGEQLFLNDVLYDVTSPISVGDAIVVNTNITAASKLSVNIKSKQDQIEVTTMPTASASNVGKVLIYIGATTSTYTSGQSYQSTLEDGNYIWKPTSISSVDASDVVYDNQTSGLTATDSQAAIDELVSQVKDMNNVLGAKNLLPISLNYLKSINTNGTWNGNAYTVDGVTYTVNTDSQGNITDITTSGTASTNSAMNIYGTDISYGKNNFSGMILNGCPSGGGPAGTDYRIVAFIGNSQDGTGHSTINDTGDGATLTNASYLRIYLRIPNGYSSSLVFKPMIRPASITDDTYQPYAKTNKELTDESELITLPAIKNDNIVGPFVIRVRKQHNAVYVTGYLNIKVAANKNDLLFTISELNFFDADDKFYILMMSSDGDTSFAEVYSNGEVKVGKNTGMPTGYYMLDSVLLMK